MHRGATGVPRVPEDLALGPDATLTEAQRLLDADLPFQAHEVLEAEWKAAAAHERDLWRGLAQLAVGLTHAQRGNAVGAAALLVRGAERIAPFIQWRPHGVDAAGLAAHATTLAARISSQGPDGLSEAERRPRLTTGDPGRASGS